MAWSDAARAAAAAARKRGKTQLGRIANFARRQSKMKSFFRSNDVYANSVKMLPLAKRIALRKVGK